MHAESNDPLVAPLKHVFSQQDAKTLFLESTVGLGKGTFGEARRAKLDGHDLAIKKFMWKRTLETLCAGKRKIPQSFEDALEEAEHEVKMHSHIWQIACSKCRAYMSAPACMNFDPNDGQNPYTVQTVIARPGYTLMSLYQYCQQHALLRDEEGTYKMSMTAWTIAEKKRLCDKIGTMMGCFIKKGVNHSDMSANNLLVLFKDIREDRNVELRVIDWGMANIVPPEVLKNNQKGVPPCVRLDNLYTPMHTPKTPEEWRMWGLGTDDGDDGDDGDNTCYGEPEDALQTLSMVMLRKTPDLSRERMFERDLKVLAPSERTPAVTEDESIYGNDTLTYKSMVDWVRNAFRVESQRPDDVVERVGAE